MALGVLSTLRSHGIHVPEDVSLIGHDDLYFSCLTGVELTTLHTPMQELGDAAAELAIALIEHGKLQPHQTFRPSLVIRRTTGGVSTEKKRTVT
jgi:DNA-binding LacI/PurR family transcriptional regulator